MTSILQIFGKTTMKKQIPEKVANKAYSRVQEWSIKTRQRSDDVLQEILYKPETTKTSNKFFKNKVSNFIYRCGCPRCFKGKLASTRKRLESTQEQLNDYL